MNGMERRMVKGKIERAGRNLFLKGIGLGGTLVAGVALVVGATCNLKNYNDLVAARKNLESVRVEEGNRAYIQGMKDSAGYLGRAAEEMTTAPEFCEGDEFSRDAAVGLTRMCAEKINWFADELQRDLKDNRRNYQDASRVIGRESR